MWAALELYLLQADRLCFELGRDVLSRGDCCPCELRAKLLEARELADRAHRRTRRHGGGGAWGLGLRVVHAVRDAWSDAGGVAVAARRAAEQLRLDRRRVVAWRML